MGQDQPGCIQALEQISSLAGQRFESSPLLRLQLSDFESKARQLRDLSDVRGLEHSQPGNVSPRYVGLPEKAEDLIRLLDRLAFFDRHLLAVPADVIAVSPTREGLVGTTFSTKAARVAHEGLLTWRDATSWGKWSQTNPWVEIWR